MKQVLKDDDVRFHGRNAMSIGKLVTDASKELVVSVFRANAIKDILRFSSSETSVTIYQSPYHIKGLKCSTSRLCHKVAFLLLLILVHTFKASLLFSPL